MVSGFAFFDALIVANAVKATPSREDPVNLVERLHTTIRPSSLGWIWFDVNKQRISFSSRIG
jgi:hypothetical protein